MRCAASTTPTRRAPAARACGCAPGAAATIAREAAHRRCSRSRRARFFAPTSHKAGKLRILAVTSTKPLLAAPELPTVQQAGFAKVTNESTYGLLAPAGTP